MSTSPWRYVEAILYGTLYKRELTIQALKECDWREGDLSILDGRRYQYKGFKKGVAIEGNFAAYEYILEGIVPSSNRVRQGKDRNRNPDADKSAQREIKTWNQH